MNHIDKIRNTMRLIAATSAAIVATGAGQAFAQISTDSSISDTGAFSDANAEFNIDRDIDVNVENLADIYNDVWADINTGFNAVIGNTTVEGDGASSGNIIGDISFANNANEDAGIVELGDILGDVDADFEIDTTGAYSEANQELNVDRRVNVYVTNEANIENLADINANTGFNATNYNTTVEGDGATSGNITIIADVENNANTGVGGVDLGDLGSDVDASASIANTGFSSVANQEVNVDDDVDLNYTNEANIANVFGINANTGFNETSYNTTVGGSSSGNAAFRLDVENNANTQ